jgi:SAM-dependent methyltransferase
MGDWESIFRKEGRHFLEPHEDMARVIRLFRKERVRRVLDLGCGSGRHTVLLARHGFRVTGMDVSPEGLRLTRQWLRETKATARLVIGDFFEPFAFADATFDAVIAVQTIHHGMQDQIRACVGEIARVLRPGGIVFVSVTVTSFRKWATAFETIAPRTYVPLDGPEAGVPHYVYTQRLLRKDFAQFEIIDLHADTRGHLCLLGRRRGVGRPPSESATTTQD